MSKATKLKLNSFVTFRIGRNKSYGIVHNVNVGHAFLIYHNGMKITTTYKRLDLCAKITKKEFLDLIDRNGDTMWYSSKEALKTFYGVTF